jgi:molecular chaperone GrpE
VSTSESTETRQQQTDASAESGQESPEASAPGATGPNADATTQTDTSAPPDHKGADVDDDLSADAAGRIEELQDELASVQNELDEINEKYLRKAAELENFRRRMERENTRRYTAGQVDVVKAMLGVLDDMGRSMDAAEELREKQDAETAYESLRGGVDMVYRKFIDELENLGVERIDAEGEPFDESLHEAMMQQPAPEGVEPGTVLNEVQAGYRMGERVIRHSRVIVAA